jgi:hypothetical protein
MDPLSALVKSHRAVSLMLCGPEPECAGETASKNSTGTENAMDECCKEMEIRDRFRAERWNAGQLWRIHIRSYAEGFRIAKQRILRLSQR